MIGDGKIPRWYCQVEKIWDVPARHYCKSFVENQTRPGHQGCGYAWRDPLGRVRKYKRGKVDK